MNAKRLMRFMAVMIVAASARGAEIVKPQDETVQPLVTYDNQGRVVRHVIFNSDNSIRKASAYQYVDSGITLETSADQNGTNGWTVAESINMTDNGVRLQKVREFDADGKQIGEKTVVVNPGSRSYRFNSQPEGL